MTRVDDLVGDPVQATAWTAIATRAGGNRSTVQVQVNERTGLDIIIDGVKENFDDLATQDFPGTDMCSLVWECDEYWGG